MIINSSTINKEEYNNKHQLSSPLIGSSFKYCLVMAITLVVCDVHETTSQFKLELDSKPSNHVVATAALPTTNDNEQEDDIPDNSIFDDDINDEDEDEFYSNNPIETVDFDVTKEFKLSDKDLEDNDPPNVTNFYANNTKSLNDSKVALASRTKRIKSKSKLKPKTKPMPKTKTKPKPKDHYLMDESHKSNTNQVGADLCAVILSQSGTCITYGAVEWAAREARRILRFQVGDDLNSLEPSEPTINSVGELNEWTTRFLAARYQLASDEIALELEQINIRLTSLWRSCPLIFRSLPLLQCPMRRYRTHSGQCNNPLGAHIGASNMPFVRSLPPHYGDSVGVPRRSSSSSELPPARLVALNLHPDFTNPSGDHSVLFMGWGQLINHDLAMAAGARAATGHTFTCCLRPLQTASMGPLANREGRVCMPILLGPDDPVYGVYGIRCHEFKRSLAGLRPGCSLGPRTQLNLMTSYVDASFVYGSSRTTSDSLRGRRRGLLATWNYFGRQNLRPLLPPQSDSPDEECVARPNGLFCFRSGDPRTNQQIHLAVLHTIHTRQHNRIALALGQLNPHWSDWRLYEESRRIHIAMVQHILLNEYLPMLLGEKLCSKYDLSESPIGSYWDHYDPTVVAGVSQAFAAAAFRQGHTTVPSEVFRYNALLERVRVYALRSVYRQPWPLFEPGAMDEFVWGLINAPAQSFDPFVSSELSGHLLQEPNEPVGLDLVAINIQRGRDQGVPGYNAFREWCGLGRIVDFGHLDLVMSNESSHLMASLYETVDDIDLFSGGLSEFTVAGAQVGPTFGCIIARQFQNLRQGDRFWFESSMSPHPFSLAQLDSIKQVTLARIMCANSDNVFATQALAMHLPHPVYNPMVACASLPDLDISLWWEPRGANQASVENNEDDDEDDGE